MRPRPSDRKCLRPPLHARPSIRDYVYQARKARHDSIKAYTAEMAGTDLDLDHDLESSGIEHLVKTGRVRK